MFKRFDEFKGKALLALYIVLIAVVLPLSIWVSHDEMDGINKCGVPIRGVVAEIYGVSGNTFKIYYAYKGKHYHIITDGPYSHHYTAGDSITLLCDTINPNNVIPKW